MDPRKVHIQFSFGQASGRQLKKLVWIKFLLAVKLLNPSVQTKPGVIRPMTAIPRLTVENEEEFYPNPFKQSVAKQTFTEHKKVGMGKHDFFFSYLIKVKKCI